MFFFRKQIGITLIELTVVLLVLVALAGVVIPYVGGTSSAALCNATDVTMQNIKKVIMERYYLDTLGHFPVSKTAGVVGNDYNLKYLFEAGGWDAFNPETQIGWRGSYLQNGIKLGSGQYLVGNLDSSFKDATVAPNNHVHTDFTNIDTVVLDGWGRPLIIQVKNNGDAKLVSAGAGSGLAINEAAIDTLINGTRTNDDRILYLNAPTPATDVNPPCNEN